jgi:alginate O-acetyltransferase complex protein AlgJ
VTTRDPTMPVEAVTLRVPEPDQKAAPPGRRPTRAQVLVTAIGLAVFFGPWVAALGGARSTASFENSKLPSAPSVSKGWQFFPLLTTWANDRFPLKDSAVRLETRLSLDVFGQVPIFGSGAGDSGVGPVGTGGGTTTPTGTVPVIFGRQGVLFYSVDFERSCHARMSPSHLIKNMNRLAAIVASAGGRLIDTVAPDKTSIEPGLLPSSYPNQSCGRPEQLAFWAAVDATPPSGYVNSYSAVRSLASVTRAQVYPQLDTHWMPRAAALYAFGVARLVGPRLLEDTKLVYTGKESTYGDLSRLSGDPRMNVYSGYAVSRKGEGPVSQRTGRVGKLGVNIYRATSSAAPLEAGQAVLFGDSFGRVAAPLLTPFFSHLVSANIASAGDDVADTAQLIVQSKIVLVEGVERALATGWDSMLTDKYLNMLSKDVDADLASHRASTAK